jgi:hypothetical protein
MPLDAEGPLSVTFRSYRDLYHDVHECYFQINFDPFGGDNASAVLVRPVGRSIQEQLLRLHMDERSATIEEVTTELRIDRDVLSEGECPALREHLDALSNVEFSAPTRDIVVLHPTVYRIEIDFGAGTVDVSLVEDDHPLVQWAIGTHAALEQCAGRASHRNPGR